MRLLQLRPRQSDFPNGLSAPSADDDVPTDEQVSAPAGLRERGGAMQHPSETAVPLGDPRPQPFLTNVFYVSGLLR
jgi:hypothetical protein